MRALDLFCCAGGATKGLQLAGFHVTGVDLEDQPRYCGDAFIRADALTVPLDGYDFIWASPPCQAYSMATNTQDKSKYPDLVAAVRERLRASGVPWVMENVIGAPLEFGFMLCGAMFGLRTYRHRLFESSDLILAPAHPPHRHKVAKMGRYPADDEYISPVGHFSGVSLVQDIYGLPGANQYELAQAIPPAYSEFIAKEFLRWT